MSADATGISRRADLGFALTTIAVAGAFIWEARKQPRAPFDPIGAAAVPIATAAILIVLALVLLARLWFGRDTGAGQSLFVGEGGEAVERPDLAAWTLALSVAYVAVMPVTGFMIATVAFLGALGWRLSAATPRALWIVAAIAVIGGAGLDWGFRRLLVDLP